MDGETYPLERPFLVIATQNNVGSVGTQMLPYAQMDRFLVRLSMGYPDHDAQMNLLRQRQNADPLAQLNNVAAKTDVLRMQAEVQAVTAKDAILDYIARLTATSREHPLVEVGISPRGALFLDRMAKAHAYLMGRDYVVCEDVQEVFLDVCAHRLLLKRQARLENVTPQDVLTELLQRVETADRRALS